MSAIEPIAPGAELLHYRFLERIGGFVWRCEDVRSGRQVAVKILTRQLPKETARRDDVFRHVRLGAALYHPFLVPVIDVVAAGDTLLLVMELVRAQSLGKYLGGKPRPAQEVFRMSYQVAEVLKFLHLRDILHGNVNGDSVLVEDDGHVRLAGLNLTNLMPRKEGTSSPVYQQKGNDSRSVAYMSAEQIAGQPVDFRTDVFSLGVVMYEMATGVLPWPRAVPGEMARTIVEGKPISPRSVNPEIAAPVVDAIARCIAKDPYQRHKDARAVAEDLAKLAPDAVEFTAKIAATMNATVAGATKKTTRDSVLLLGEVDSDDAEVLTTVAAKMQQILGEAAYLFDGQVVDPFGVLLVAELPSVEAGIEAGRKAEFDLLAEEENGEELPIRFVLHAGELTIKDGRATGDDVTRGFESLEGGPHRRLQLTEDFVKLGRGKLRLRDAGARGGVKLYEIAPPEVATPASQASRSTGPTPNIGSVSTIELSGPPLPEGHPKRQRVLLASGAGLLLLVLGTTGVILTRRTTRPPAPAPVAKPATPVAHDVAIAPFAVEGADPLIVQRAAAIRLAAIEILRHTPDLTIVEETKPGVLTFSAAIRQAGGAPVVVPTRGGADAAAAIPLGDNASAVQSLVDCVARQTRTRPNATTPAALNAFTDALAARANNDAVNTDAALHAAIAADASFLPLQAVAMDIFSAEGNDKDAFESARQVMALSPRNIDAARLVGRGSLARGDVPAALAAYGEVLHVAPTDVESLNTIGNYSFSAGDSRHFAAALVRLKQVTPSQSSIHEPDLLTAAGRFDDAIQKYYDVEVEVPNNAALSLKIGRIAVLRHTTDIAKLELEKLQKSDPDYGYHLLKAYIAAANRARDEVDSELATALKASRPGDSYWTSAAEVYALVGDAKKVLSCLQTAADRREPTISYVLADPLFEFLGSEPKFQQLRTTLTARKVEIRAALAKIAI